MLAVISDGDVSIYHIKDGRKDTISSSLQGDIGMFSPDGTWFVVWYQNGSGSIWRVTGWTKERDISIPYSEEIVGFSPDDRFIIFQNNQLTTIYQIENWKIKRQIPVINDQWGRTIKISFSPSCIFFGIMQSIANRSTSMTETVVRIWDITSRERLAEVKLQGGISDFLLSDDGSFTKYQIPENICKVIGISLQENCVHSIAWHNSNIFFSNSGNQFTLWKNSANLDGTRVNQICHIKPGEGEDCRKSFDISFLNSDGELYQVRSDDREEGYEIFQGLDYSGPLLGRFYNDMTIITPLWLSPDSRILLISAAIASYTSHQEEAELWNIETGTLIKRWSGWLYAYDVNSDASLLALGFTDRRIIYDIQGNQIIYSQNTNGFELSSLMFNDDDNFIFATGSNGAGIRSYSFQINILDINSLKATAIATVTTNDLVLDAFDQSADGSLLAVGTPQGVIYIYDSTTGRELFSWQAHFRDVTQLNFSSDGTFLVSYSLGSQNGGDGILKVWGIGP